MKRQNKIGDLVHIPQASILVSYSKDLQKIIPFTTVKLEEPKVAVVVGRESQGYIPVLWDGKMWSVKAQDIYMIKEKIR